MKPQNYETFDPEEEKNNEKIIDKIIESNGYGKYQFKGIIFCLFIGIIDGVQVTLTSSMFIPLRNFWNVTEFNYAVLSSIIYIGCAIGSFIAGKVSHYFKRKYLNFVINLLLALLQVSFAFITNFYLIFILRLLVGIIIGITLPISMNNLIEILPIKYRSLVYNSVWSFAALGTFYVSGMMLIFTPNFEIEGVPYVLLTCSLPNILLCSIYFFIYEDNPRYLIIHNQVEEAFKILAYIANRQIPLEEEKKIIAEVYEYNQQFESSISSMFVKKLLKTTVLTIIIWSFLGYVYFASNFTFQNTLQKINSISNLKLKPRDIIMSQFIIASTTMPSYYVVGFLSEIKILGRIWTAFSFAILSFIFLILAVSLKKYFSLFFGMFNFSFIGSLNISLNYSTEFYPTKIRDSAIGFLYFCYRIFSFLSLICAVGFENILFLLNYYVCIGIILILAISIIMLPHETNGKPIDFEYDPNEKKS